MSAGLQGLLLSIALGVVVGGKAVAQQCGSDDDCSGDGFCNLRGSAKTGACASGHVTCSSDDHCPDGLSCRTGTCTFVVQRCATEAQCPADHSCVDTTPCDAEGGSEECEQGDDKVCSPNPLDCSADEDCPAMWRCEARADDDAAAAGRGAVASACLPLGFALAVRGHAPIARERTDAAQEAGSGDGTGPQSNADASGCSASVAGLRSGPSGLLASFMLTAVLLRRARRAQRRS